jgi:hypothetical protein
MLTITAIKRRGAMASFPSLRYRIVPMLALAALLMMCSGCVTAEVWQQASWSKYDHPYPMGVSSGDSSPHGSPQVLFQYCALSANSTSYAFATAPVIHDVLTHVQLLSDHDADRFQHRPDYRPLSPGKDRQVESPPGQPAVLVFDLADSAPPSGKDRLVYVPESLPRPVGARTAAITGAVLVTPLTVPLDMVFDPMMLIIFGPTCP